MVDILLYEQYCSTLCRRVAADDHHMTCRPDTTADIDTDELEPEWAKEDRDPDFLEDDPMTSPPYLRTIPWGGLPAYDILQLERNEGLDWDQDLNLLFTGMSQQFTVVLAEPRGDAQKTKC